MMFTKNRIRQTLLSTGIALLSFSSCKKDDVETPPPPAKTPQLAKFTNGAETTQFSYNADGSFKSITLSTDPLTGDDNITYTAQYGANQKMTQLNGTNGAVLRLTYANSLLSKMEGFTGTDKFVQTTYEYAGTVLKSSTHAYADNGAMVPFFKGDYTFTAGGNISRVNTAAINLITNQLEADGHVMLQYDDKVNPFAALGDVYTIFWQAVTKNNLTKQQHYNKNGVPGLLMETTYTYNAQGYPTAAVEKEQLPGEPPVLKNLSYTYQ
jgi:YD repeat-containing protein